MESVLLSLTHGVLFRNVLLCMYIIIQLMDINLFSIFLNYKSAAVNIIVQVSLYVHLDISSIYAQQ